MNQATYESGRPSANAETATSDQAPVDRTPDTAFERLAEGAPPFPHAWVYDSRAGGITRTLPEIPVPVQIDLYPKSVGIDRIFLTPEQSARVDWPRVGDWMIDARTRRSPFGARGHAGWTYRGITLRAGREVAPTADALIALLAESVTAPRSAESVSVPRSAEWVFRNTETGGFVAPEHWPDLLAHVPWFPAGTGFAKVIHPDYGTPSLVAVTPDGAAHYFSKSAQSHDARQLRAMRRAVDGQIADARARLAGSACEWCGAPAADGDVDHADPWPFAAIVVAFREQHAGLYATDSRDGRTAWLDAEWPAFHAERARLRLLHTACHRARTAEQRGGAR
jgi:hypothetical protein